MRESAPPAGFRITSRREALRLRKGLAVLAASVLLPTLATIQLTIICLYWFQLSSNVWRKTIYLTWLDVQAYVPLLEVLAIWLIIRAPRCGTDRSWSRLGVTAFAMSLSIPVLFLVRWTAPYLFSSGSSRLTPLPVGFVGVFLELCRPIALLMAWLFLLRKHDLARPGCWRIVLYASIIAPSLQVLEYILRFLQFLEFRFYCEIEQSGQMFSFTSTMRYDFLSELTWRWHKYVGASSWIVMLLLIWWLVRKLNAPPVSAS